MHTNIPKSKPNNAREKRQQYFRDRYRDGMVEIGIGMILILLTLLNKSEYFFTKQTAIMRILVLMQPLLSLLVFAGGVYGMRYFRHQLLLHRSGPEEIPLSSPVLWATLLMMVLLISAPLVWPIEAYAEAISAQFLCGLGLLLGVLMLGLGVKNGLQRFMLLGGGCVALTLLFTFVGIPAVFLIS